ncbi:MAG: FAD-dependent oxidoreductase [Desulfobacterales bacterium]
MIKEAIPAKCDAVVIGSGGAGLVAALRLKRLKKDWSVWLIEQSDLLGGSTSYSGGVCWLPGHQFMNNPERDAEKARIYLKNAFPQIHEPSLDGFLTDSPRALEFMLSSGLKMEAISDYPDYYMEIQGSGYGHSVSPDTYTGPKRVRKLIRQVPHFFPPFSVREAMDWGPHRILNWDKTLLAKRKMLGHQTMGRAFIGFLVEACLNAGVHIALNCKTEGLLIQNGQVQGAVINGKKTDAPIIVIACGGFSHNPELTNRLAAVRPFLSVAPEACDTGGGLQLALEAGLKIGNPYCWWVPIMKIYDENDSKPGPDLWAYHPMLYDRAWPGGIMVNSDGKRFTNESACYNSVGGILALDEDPMLNRVWLIWGNYYVKHYIRGVTSPFQPAKSYMNKSKGIEELAGKIGVPAENLKATLEHWNEMAVRERDDDFHRGESPYDRYMGDRFREAHPNIERVEPPFQAVRVYPGCLGTKMGPITDEFGRVQLENGGTVSGLYAAGNAAAAFLGNIYPGAGGTLGQGVVFGYRSANHAAGL